MKKYTYIDIYIYIYIYDPDLSVPTGFRAKMEQLKPFYGLFPESRCHNLALTVLYMPYLLDSGAYVRIASNKTATRVAHVRNCESAVERRWHIKDSQRQIMALAFR